MRAGEERDPPRRAIALEYDPNRDAAPGVVARGAGEVADAILRIARAHDVPVREDPDLLELLAACELGDEVPVELYGVVAELLAYLWRLNEEAGEGPTRS